jgi:hypothetical protein
MPALDRFRLLLRAAGLCVLGLLVGCGGAPDVSTRSVPLDNYLRIQAEEAMRGSISEPMSSFYRMQAAYVTAEGDYVVCGEVNAKKRGGDYAGFTPFFVRFEIRGARVRTKSVLLDRFTAPAACAQVARGVG